MQARATLSLSGVLDFSQIHSQYFSLTIEEVLGLLSKRTEYVFAAPMAPLGPDCNFMYFVYVSFVLFLHILHLQASSFHTFFTNWLIISLYCFCLIC